MTRGRRRSLLLALLTTALSASANTQTADAQEAAGANLDFGLTLIGVAIAVIAALILKPVIARIRERMLKLRFRQRMHRALANVGPQALHDFLLPGAYGGLTRIDHAVMAGGSIVCIRAKQLRGRIANDLRDSQWEIEHADSRHRFLNPVIQNEGRAEALRRLVPDVPVRSLIVVDGPVTYARDVYEHVIPLAELSGFLDTLRKGATDAQNDDAWRKIRSAALTDPESRKDFAAQLSFG